MSVPRWKTVLEKSIESTKQTTFQLATLDRKHEIPHVRSHIFRAFLESPNAPSLPLLITTTDIRTPKIDQIFAQADVELAWWIAGNMHQFRIAGHAGIIAAKGHPLHRHFVEVTLPLRRMRESGSAIDDYGIDWEAKRLEIFGTMSAHMKASWCRPTPGTKLKGGADEAKKWPVRVEEPKEGDSEEAKKNWEMALRNFALVIIDPFRVDFVDMGIVPNERTIFTRVTQGNWVEEAVVP